MGKNRKDAVGGHYDHDLTIMVGDVEMSGWTPKFKRFAKDRSNRMIRRQQKQFTANAMVEYEDDNKYSYHEKLALESFENDMSYHLHLDDIDEYNRQYAEDMAELERIEYERTHDFYDTFDSYDPYEYEFDSYFELRVLSSYSVNGQEFTYYGA